MKNMLFFIIGITFIFSNEKEGEIGFRYGFLSKPSYDSDSLSVLSDSSVIVTGDRLQLNIAYANGTDFCVIYNGAQGEYLLLFPQGDDIEKSKASSQDTLYKYVLNWREMRQPPGLETFYFINSVNSLVELEALVERYENAPPNGQKLLSRRIKKKIDAFDPDILDDISSLTSQLDKPVVGGVAFRGEDDNGLHDFSVTHECMGTGGIAFRKIVLKHQ